MNGLTILYEDEEIFVINKNSGLAVQGGANVKHSIDVDFADEIGQKIFLVHRLDKDTAGLMIVAKNPAAAAKWTKLISGKTVKKEYIAICAGTIEPKKGIICEKIVQHGEEKERAGPLGPAKGGNPCLTMFWSWAAAPRASARR